MRIFLIGFMGSGKSKRGRKLAAELGYAFEDMDDCIEKEEAATIPELFLNKGEEYFRLAEHKVLLNLLRLDNVVISTGGGAPCYFDAMHRMNECGVTIYLKGSPAFLAERLQNSQKKRPLIENLRGEELVQFIDKKLKEREPVYAKAKYIVEAIGLHNRELIDICLEARRLT